MTAPINTQHLRHLAHAIRFEICGDSGRLIEAAANELDALRQEIKRLKEQLSHYQSPR